MTSSRARRAAGGVAPVVADHERHAGFLEHNDQLIQFILIQRHRLFQEYRLASLAASIALLCVKIVARTNHDGVNVRIIQHILNVCAGVGGPKLLGGCLGVAPVLLTIARIE